MKIEIDAKISPKFREINQAKCKMTLNLRLKRFLKSLKKAVLKRQAGLTSFTVLVALQKNKAEEEAAVQYLFQCLLEDPSRTLPLV